jgi:hypothetical protein
MLRTYFAFTNQILPAVDEDYFWAALEEARYYDDPAAGEGELLDGEGGRDAVAEATRESAGGGAGAGAGAGARHGDGQVLLETPLGYVTQAGIAARVELEQRMQAPPHELAAAAAEVARQASSSFTSRPSPLAAVAPPSDSGGRGEGHGSTPRADDPRLLDEAEALGALAAAPRRVTAPLARDREGLSSSGGPLVDTAAAPTAASAGEALAALSLAPSPASAVAASADPAGAALSMATSSAADGAHKKQAQVIAARAVQMHRRMHLLQRNSEAYGFRVCYFMLLCVGAKTQVRGGAANLACGV